MAGVGARKSKSAALRQPAWAALSDDDLLQAPLKDLKLSLRGTWLDHCLGNLNAELRARAVGVRAHGWISEEWFSPQHTLGIAFPFYLAHPRLMRLERKMMHEVEGGTQRDCMRILRHEAGHVVQHAFALHRRKRWQSLFGRATLPYPEHYQPDPASKAYVQHLPRWYAQCHPDEDFAETFAIWLTPRANWRRRYADWPALEKLMYVDAVMAELAGERPPAYQRIQVDPLSALTQTLGEHYKSKRKRYAIDTPTVFDRDLRRIFRNGPRQSKAALAATAIARNRARIIRGAQQSAGDDATALNTALDDMMTRCRAMGLRAPDSDEKVRQAVTAVLTSKAVHSHYSASRRRWFAV